MKRLSSSDSLYPLCPSGAGKCGGRRPVLYRRWLKAADGEEVAAERRAAMMLEKNFKVENKLEPKRKVLAWQLVFANCVGVERFLPTELA